MQDKHWFKKSGFRTLADGTPATKGEGGEYGSWSPPGSEITDYGLLRFRAATTRLALRAREPPSKSANCDWQQDILRFHPSRVVTNMFEAISRIFRRLNAVWRHFIYTETVYNMNSTDKVTESSVDSVRFVNCALIASSGIEIGRVSVPSTYLAHGERLGYFTLLSSNVENDKPKTSIDGNEEGNSEYLNDEDAKPAFEKKFDPSKPSIIKSRNVMLVDFENDIAYRVAWMRIKDADWCNVVTE